MFLFAFLIGIYSYIIFFLGLTTLLYPNIIVYITTAYVTLGIIIYYTFQRKIVPLKIEGITECVIFLLISLQIIVNLIGTFGPELAFDALWYHLTIPKIFLLHHSIFHIPGNLLYYSDMPKLTEMIYILPLAFHNEIAVKIIHFIFGLLSTIGIYKIARIYFNRKFSLLCCLVFYSNLVVAWESITAYIDLSRTFFEVLALYAFLLWTKDNKKRFLILSACMIGFAICTKLLSIGSVGIFLLLILFYGLYTKNTSKQIFKNIILYVFISFFVPLPWFAFSFINTGNPVYPFFSGLYGIPFTLNLLNPVHFLSDTWNMFLYSADPVNPLYLILLPFLFIQKKIVLKKYYLLLLYCLIAIIIWYLEPRTGGGRFILPYLPAFSIFAIAIINTIQKKSFQKLLIFIVFFISIVSILYRFSANSKYISYLLGKENKQQFLSKNLNFSFGDFYDIDNFFKKNIKTSDTVLIYGIHNLYYVDFPFIHESWVKKGDKFNYVLLYNQQPLPKKLENASLIYTNSKSNIKLYKNNNSFWVY